MAALLPPLPRRQVREQREVERLRRVELHVVDAGAAQLAVVAQRQPGQLAQVARRAPPRARRVTSSALSTSRNLAGPWNGNVSSCGSRTWNTMTSVPRNFRCRSPLITGSGSSSRSEISTTRLRLTSASASWCSGRPTFGLRARLHPLEREQQRVQVAGPRAGRQPERDPVVERDQPGRVALPVHQERERRRQHRAVFELAHRRRAAIRHRGADVEQQVALEVGLLLELLDVVPIGARVDLPVERRQIVAGQVLPVLGELDAEALVTDCGAARRETPPPPSAPSAPSSPAAR